MPSLLNPRRRRQRAALLDRLSHPAVDAYTCPIPGCGRPSEARAGNGLSVTHCRLHVQLHNRTGSFWKGSYTAAELKPYRRAAAKYLKAHADDFWIAHALTAIRALLDNAGPVERTADVLHFMTPAQKARTALARLRKADIPPERLLVSHLAVTAALAEDPVGPGGTHDEYQLVQVAKVVHRLAAGPPTILGKYPRSGGLALRNLGRLVGSCCEHVAERHMAAILSLKTSLYGPPGDFAKVNARSFRG